MTCEKPISSTSRDELDCAVAFNLWWESLPNERRTAPSGVVVGVFRAGWLAGKDAASREGGDA
ncbi:hypothetical protein [Brucella anthropi]|uniref:hypothetical protein n=1 Tax=Brucella anthropi TaxID=529 RepID=UPI00384CA765